MKKNIIKSSLALLLGAGIALSPINFTSAMADDTNDYNISEDATDNDRTKSSDSSEQAKDSQDDISDKNKKDSETSDGTGNENSSKNDDEPSDSSLISVNSLRISKENVFPGDTVSIIADVSDENMTIRFLTVTIPVNEYHNESVTLTYGENDVLEGSFTIGDNWKNGEHKISDISITLHTGSEAQTKDTTDVERPAITVSDSPEIIIIPKVTEIRSNKTSLSPGDDILISVDIEHELDIDEVIATFTHKDGDSRSITIDNYTDTSNFASLSVDNTWKTGEYTLSHVYVRDTAGNIVYYDENHENLTNVKSPVLVVSGISLDTQGPEVKNIAFDKSEVSVDDEITLFAQASDISGISRIEVVVENDSGATMEYELRPDKNGDLKKVIKPGHLMKNGLYSITRVVAYDKLNNETALLNNMEGPFQGQTSYILKDSNENPEGPVINQVAVSSSNATPGDAVEFIVNISDDDSIFDAQIRLYRPGSNELYKVATLEKSQDGSFIGIFNIDDTWYNSNFDVRVFAVDSEEHVTNEKADVIFTVSDSMEDHSPPELVSASIDKKVIVPGESMTILAKVTDQSIIDYVYGSLYLDGVIDDDADVFELYYDEEDGLYKAEIAVDDKWSNGDYSLFIHTGDYWDFYEDDIDANVSVTVKDSAQDQEGPLVKYILFDKTSVKPGDTVTVHANAEDPHGVDYIQIYLEPQFEDPADYLNHINAHSTLTLTPDKNGLLSESFKISNSWANVTYEIGLAQAYDELGNVRSYMYSLDEIPTNTITVSGATGESTDLEVTSVTFTPEKARIGEDVTVTATITGNAIPDFMEIDIDDGGEDGVVWDENVILYPKDGSPGIMEGTFNISPTDYFWKKNHQYGLSDIYIADVNHNSRYYMSRGDAEYVEDLRNIKSNTFTVDIYAPHVTYPADYSATDDAIKKVPSDLTMFSEESVNNLKNALNAVIRGKTREEQGIVDFYADAILKALDELELKPADYTSVHDAISLVPADLSVYTNESVNVLENALSSIKWDLNITQQLTVEKCSDDIKNAIAGLIPIETEPSKPSETEPVETSEVPETTAPTTSATEQSPTPWTKPSEVHTVPVPHAEVPESIPTTAAKPVQGSNTTIINHPVTGDPITVMTASKPYVPETGNKDYTIIWIACSVAAISTGVTIFLLKSKKHKE